MSDAAKELTFYLSKTESEHPPVDIFETEEMLIIEADVPGVDIRDISINVASDELVISGIRKKERPDEYRKYLCMERNTDTFKRKIEMPIKVNAVEGRARYINGVLRISIPKFKDKVVKIEIER